MSTVAQLLSAVRSEIIEPTAGFWTDPEITGWIQDAYNDMVKAGRIERAPYSFSTVAGTEAYTMPTDFFAARRVELQAVSTTSWLPLVPESLDEHTPAWFLLTNQGRGFPRGWFVYNEQLYLVPTPDVVYNAKVYYYARGATLATTDTPIIDSDFHTYLAKYAIAMAKRKQDDPGWTQYAAEYNAGRLAFVQEMEERRNGARPKMVTDDWAQLT